MANTNWATTRHANHLDVKSALAVAAAALSLALYACGSSGNSINAKVGTVLDERTVAVGQTQKSMSLGSGTDTTELSFPAGIFHTDRNLTLRLSNNVVKAGAQPAGSCVQVADDGVSFEKPAQMRQVLPPAPDGMKYMAMRADEQAADWTLVADARVALLLGGGGSDASTTEPTLGWEMDMHGSGLWAMALVPMGTSVTDGGTPADGGTTTGDDATPPNGDGDGAAPDGTVSVTGPQLTQLVPAQASAGAVVPLEVHGRGIAPGWSIVFDGKPVTTTVAAVTLNGVADGAGALGTVTLDLSVATGQVPVWLAMGNARSNTLYFNVAPTLGAPAIIDYTPDNGLPGAQVSIIGRNLIAEAVTIRDPLGRVIPVVTTGTTTWVGATLDRLDIVIPADMTSGVFTATNTKGSFRGRIFNVGQNLARLPGATAQSSTQYNTTNWSTISGWDNNLQTSWFSAGGDCATLTTCTMVPFFQVTFPTPQTVARIAMRGNREYASGYDFVEGWFEVRAADGTVLNKMSYVLPQPDRDLDVVFPSPIAGASVVRFTSIADESNEPGFSELEVFGP